MGLGGGHPLRLHLARAAFGPEEVRARTAAIRARMLRASEWLDGPNFTRIAEHDLAFLFQLYDHEFFKGLLSDTLSRRGEPVCLRLSARMSKASGKTICYTTHEGRRFEIVLSTALLFSSFGAVRRPIRVSGLVCRDRLDALQRTFEHELVHLAEYVCYGHSSCKLERFVETSARLFDHQGTHHELISQAEQAYARHRVRVGAEVRFQLEGQALRGRVNRITRRATVLVPSLDGELYDDGARYRKYYVPVALLEPLG